MQPMARLPALPGHEIGERVQSPKRPQIESLIACRPRARVPPSTEGGKTSAGHRVLKFFPGCLVMMLDERLAEEVILPATFQPRTFRLSDSVARALRNPIPAMPVIALSSQPELASAPDFRRRND